MKWENMMEIGDTDEAGKQIAAVLRGPAKFALTLRSDGFSFRYLTKI